MEPQDSELITEPFALTKSDLLTQTAARRQLNVLVDCRKLGDGGIGVYVDNLVRGLLGTKGALITVLGNRQKLEATEWGSEVKILEDDTARYSMGELFGLSRRINFSNYDIFHTPHYILPFGIRCSTIVTVHDLIHIEHPQRFYYPFVALRLMKSSLRRATAVISVSESTKKSMLELFGFDDHLNKKLQVIPNSLNSSLLEGKGAPIVVKKAQELRPYILCVVSQFKPHKGLTDLLEAYAMLRERGVSGRVPRLVLVGQGMEAVLNSPATLERFGMVDGVHIEGPVTRDELISWYKCARAVVIPSKAEGFCLPLLEAQSFGIPAVIRPVPAMKEIVSPVDVVAKDFSISSLTDALESALELGNQDLGKPIQQHLSRFSVEKVASRTLDLYWQAVLDTAEKR